jgi:DNA-binding protein WhiA
MSFLRTKRRSEDIIYTSNSNLLEDFFATIGLNSLTFLLINSKIENEFKNTANRIRNCETNNIDKTISASLKWVNAIEALEKANLLSTLPEELEKTARLRLEYKDYSLARLAAEFSPPISKPGLSHRLNKILEIYENLLKNN